MANETTSQVAVRQLRAVAEHAERLDEFIEKSKTIHPAITVREATKQLAATTSFDEIVLMDIFIAIDQIATMAKNLGTTDKAIDRLLDLFGKEKLASLQEKRTIIAKALDLYNDDNPVAISLKATRLKFLHENLLTDAEIITDARPVYDSEGKKVLEFIIAHSLVVTYRTHGEPKRIHFAIDADDVLKIQNACVRAIVKASSLKDALGDKARVVADDAE